jgi:hypothetical protein
LNVEEAVVGVHRVGEHAPELHALHGPREALQITVDRDQRVVVVLGARELVELLGVTQAGTDALERAYRVLETLAFAPELLGAASIGPDSRIFDQRADFLETLALGFEVKDTS